MSWPTSVRNIVGSRTLSAAVGGQHSTRRALMSRAFTNRAIQSEGSKQQFTNLQFNFSSYLNDGHEHLFGGKYKAIAQ